MAKLAVWTIATYVAILATLLGICAIETLLIGRDGYFFEAIKMGWCWTSLLSPLFATMVIAAKVDGGSRVPPGVPTGMILWGLPFWGTCLMFLVKS